MAPDDLLESVAPKHDATHRAGPVPLGGVGAGAVELGRDARFYQFSINNNRGAHERIARSEHTFLALRLGVGDTVYCRRLQLADAGVSGESAGPPLIEAAALVWRGVYPTAHYRLEDPACPATVRWSHFGPMAPFDYDGSMLPVLFTMARIENTTDAPMTVSLAFCLENLVGHTGARAPETAAPCTFHLIEEERRYRKVYKQREGPAPSEVQAAPGRAGEAPPPQTENLPPNNAVCFGDDRPPKTNADGRHMIVLRATEDMTVTLAAWDPADPKAAAAQWAQFEEAGDLGGAQEPGPSPHGCGSACGTVTLAPGAAHQFEFIFAWYCPHFEVAGTNMGTAYTGTRRSIEEIATHAVKYVNYFAASIRSWQKRLRKASLPPWLNMFLLNSLHVFATNTFLTYNEAFGMVQSPDAPRTACLDNRLYSSLGEVLFYPRFAELELLLIGRAEQPQSTGRLPRDLGAWCLHQFELNHPAPLRTELAAAFVVMAYRDFLLTGKVARVQDLYPVLRAVSAAVAALDRDGDGLPDCAGQPSATYDGVAGYGLTCIAAGLWVVALRGMAFLAEKLHNPAEAQRFTLLCKRAAASFERRYWHDAEGYYHLFHGDAGPNAAACHTAQLTGPWYAAFMGVEGLFVRAHIDRALDRILTLNRESGHVVAARLPDGSPCDNAGLSDAPPCEAHYAWPGYMMGHLASLLAYRGRVSEAVRLVERAWKAIRKATGTVFDFPEKWDIARGAPPPGGPGRHASVLSGWYLLYAIEGFFFHAPDQHLCIKPNLPEGVPSLSAPLVTPVCLGWLNYKVDDHEGYRQRLRVRLDSPIQVSSFSLRVPKDVPAVRVSLREVGGEPVPVNHLLRPDGGCQELYLQARKPMLVTSDILLEVVRTEPPPPEPAPVR
ncbi:MAG: GH116 family glycosyl hydrolase [Candidatus Hydrogenedentota bacterium]